jgi:hypothetical protein
MSQHVERFAAAASGLARAERDGRRGRFLSPGRRPHEAGEKLKRPLTSAGRQRQTQFASSSSNGGDVTSNLSRHRWHSFLPLREFDQQLGLFFGPFAGFCRLHFCSTDRIRHQSKR